VLGVSFLKEYQMKNQPIPTIEKIKQIKELLTRIDGKLLELQSLQRDLIRQMEALKRELEFEKMYD
jgi:hypothetical protein